METKNNEDANIDSTEDGTKDNLNPSTLNVNNSITRVRLEVENNKFISANGRRILKSTTCSTSIRDLLNELTSKQRESVLGNSEAAVDDTNIEKLEAISDKALITVVHRTDDTKNIIEDKAFPQLGSTGPLQVKIKEGDIHTETIKSTERTSNSESIYLSEAERTNNDDDTVHIESFDSDMIRGRQEEHPEMLSSNLSTLKFLAESEPRAVMEGSTIRFMGSSQTGDSLYWIQGEVSDASNPRKEAEEDKSESNNVTVENLMMVNYWGKECNMRLPRTMTIELN